VKSASADALAALPGVGRPPQAARPIVDGRKGRPHILDVYAQGCNVKERVMSRSSNAAVLEGFGSAVNTDHLGELEEYVAPDSVDHDPAPGQVPGPEGYEEMFATMRRAFPDLHIEVEHVMATDDEIAFAYTITGTHLGELMGHSATGKTVSYRGMQISRFADGKMVERWGSSDELGMLRQLGLT
jgi:steroid delta-isomerase-like uncharacterized protein